MFTLIFMSIRDLFGKARTRFTSPWGYAYNTYDNREDYYQNLLPERSNEALLHWLSLSKEAIVNARVEVSFRNIKFRSSSQAVRRQFGRPRFAINNPLVSGHEVYFYRFTVGHLHSVAALHFLDQEFFMASHSFRQLTAQNYQQIVETLTTKYGLLPPPKSVPVKDRQNNTVLVDEGLYLTIRYVSGDPSFQKRLLDLLERKGQYRQQQRSRQASLLNDFL